MTHANIIANSSTTITAMLSTKKSILNEHKQAELDSQDMQKAVDLHENLKKVDEHIYMQQNKQKSILSHEVDDLGLNDKDNINHAYSLKKRESANIVASVIFCIAKVQEYLDSIANLKYLRNLNILFAREKPVNEVLFDHATSKVKVKEKEHSDIAVQEQIYRIEKTKQENSVISYSHLDQKNIIRKQITDIINKLISKEGLSISDTNKQKVIGILCNLIDNIEDQEKSSQKLHKVITELSKQSPESLQLVFKGLLLFSEQSRQSTVSFFPSYKTNSLSSHIDKFIQQEHILQMISNDVNENSTATNVFRA